MRTTFFLIRHALKIKDIGDVSITNDGILQAQSTARLFDKVPVTAIVSSPLRRARETAEYIRLLTNTEIIVDERLRERANWGDLPGQSFDEFIKMWDMCTRDPEYIPEVGDSSRQAAERLADLILELVNTTASGSNFILVTHGGLITDFLVNTMPEEELNNIHLNFIKNQSQLVPECSVTKLTFQSGKYIIEYFSSTDHLK